jgi:hypothetical protein
MANQDSITRAATENTDPFDGKNMPHPFWSTGDDLETNWDKSFPFQLLWLRKHGSSYSVADIESRFTLPIPPEALSIGTPFAINLSITQGGALEEHNGAPLRNITLSGTTGVFPLRGSVTAPNDFSSASQGIFAGTVNSVRGIATAISQANNLLSGGTNTPVNVVSETDMTPGSPELQGTGFYQFILLKRFLEAYVEKKRKGDKDLRLGLAIWKEQEIYLVTPRSFDLSRNAQRPQEYPFSLSLTAWRRVALDDRTGAASPYQGTVGTRDPNTFAQLVNTLETGRAVLEGARTVLQSVRADIQNVLFTPLRQATLFAKDAVGLVLTAVDFPTDIISDLREPLLEMAAAKNSVNELSRVGSRFQRNFDASVNAIQEAFRQLSVSSGKADTRSGRDVASRRDGLFGDSQNGNNADPVNKIVDTPIENYPFFSTIRPSDLNLRPNTIKKMEAERKSVQSLRREDFERARNQAVQVLADFSDFIGAGDTTYTSTYHMPVRTTTRTPTDDEWDVVFSLNEVIQQYDALAATASVNRNQVTSLDYVAGLARRSGIAFQVPKSKFSVPFPYGSTLETLSNRYLGTPGRWHEIATLNGLRAPYVDEVGFKLNLLVNGNANQILVSDASNLFVGQKLWIESTTTLRESRRIQKVTPVGTHFAVLLDGEPDLSKFTTASQSFVQAFLPDTVNSQQQIYIPSDAEPAEDGFLVKSIPGVNYFDPLVSTCGIDWLLTQDNDIIITPDGDGRLAAGLVNQIQKIRLALATPKGSLMYHPEYGLGLKPGTSTADVSAQQIKSDISQLFRNDPSFTGVSGVSVQKDGGVVRIKMSIGIAGTSQYIPIQVDVKQ